MTLNDFLNAQDDSVVAEVIKDTPSYTKCVKCAEWHNLEVTDVCKFVGEYITDELKKSFDKEDRDYIARIGGRYVVWVPFRDLIGPCRLDEMYSRGEGDFRLEDFNFKERPSLKIHHSDTLYRQLKGQGYKFTTYVDVSWYEEMFLSIDRLYLNCYVTETEYKRISKKFVEDLKKVVTKIDPEHPTKMANDYGTLRDLSKYYELPDDPEEEETYKRRRYF